MEPGHRTEREITYKEGWKRGKIKIRSNNPEADEAVEPNRPTGVTPWLAQTMSRIAGCMWQSTGTLPERYLYIALWAFPALSFGMSVWLVYKLAIRP
jgi:hypothetical protein